MKDNEITNPGWVPMVRDDDTIPPFLNPLHHEYTKAEIKSIHRHENKLIQGMKALFKVDSTTYYVMRNKIPY
jgi:hypothetical protein